MGLIDWQKYASPPISLSPGLSALSEALDQVAQRRAAEKKAQAEADAKLAEQLRADHRAEMGQQETNRHNLSTESSADRNAGLEQTRLGMDAWGRAAPMLEVGNRTLAAPFVQAAQGPPSSADTVNNLLGLSAGVVPPRGPAPPAAPDPLSVSPPPWTGDGPPPLTQPQGQAAPLTPPTQAQPPTLDLLDATMQGIEADKKKRQAGDVADFKAAMKGAEGLSPFHQQAMDYAVRAGQGGQLGKQTIQEAYQHRVDRLESEAERIKEAGIKAQSYQNPELRNDAATRADLAEIRKNIGEYMKEADSKTLLKSNRTLKSAISNIATEGPGSVMQHKDAFYAMERHFRQGTPTDAETHFMLNRMGGIPGAVQKFLEEMKTGDLSDITKRNIAAAAKRAKGDLDENVNNLIGGLRDLVGPGSGAENYGPQVNREIRARGRQFDLDLPNLYQETGGAALGSGKRPPKTGGKPAKGLSHYQDLYDSLGGAK